LKLRNKVKKQTRVKNEGQRLQLLGNHESIEKKREALENRG